MSQIEKLLSEADSEYVKEIDVIWHLLFISSHKMLFNISLVQALQALIPPSVIKFMEKWNEEPMENSHVRELFFTDCNRESCRVTDCFDLLSDTLQ